MALKPCRECGKEVSETAGTCPHCGIKKPVPLPLSKYGGCLATLITGVIILLIVLSIGDGAKAPQQTEQDAAFNIDYKTLTAAGYMVVAAGDANKYEISGWNTSLDLYLSTLSELKAATLSDYLCHTFFAKTKLNKSWNVRVFLVDGRLGGQCAIFSQP